jgi:hypothetical protein
VSGLSDAKIQKIYENERRNCGKLAAQIHKKKSGGLWRVYPADEFHQVCGDFRQQV